MKRILFFILFYFIWFGLLPLRLMLWPAFSYGAGEVTATYQDHKSIRNVKIYYSTLANGSVSGLTLTNSINGIINSIQHTPFGNQEIDDNAVIQLKAGSSSGWTVFDLTITNPTLTQAYYPGIVPITPTGSGSSGITRIQQPVAIDDKLSLVVSGGGAGSAGFLTILYR